MLTIVNYGSGNIKAIANVYQKLGAPFRIAQAPAELAGATRILLPGVGIFDETIKQLQRSGFTVELNAHVNGGTPVLGICVGMQIMAECSEEGTLPGLGWVKGRVRRFDTAGGQQLPHMGWIKNTNQAFHSAIEVSMHEICRSDPVFRIAVVQEVEDARVLEESS